MSGDHLTRLVARSRGAIRAARPRLPSIFEPPTPGSAHVWQRPAEGAADVPAAFEETRRTLPVADGAARSPDVGVDERLDATPAGPAEPKAPGGIRAAAGPGPRHRAEPAGAVGEAPPSTPPPRRRASRAGPPAAARQAAPPDDQQADGPASADPATEALPDVPVRGPASALDAQADRAEPLGRRPRTPADERPAVPRTAALPPLALPRSAPEPRSVAEPHAPEHAPAAPGPPGAEAPAIGQPVSIPTVPGEPATDTPQTPAASAKDGISARAGRPPRADDADVKAPAARAPATLALNDPAVPTLGTAHRTGHARSTLVPGHGGASDPPIVRVTIGRVEVRAITEPPPAAEEPAPAAPALSLEDYLRQRNRGPQ